MNSDRIEAYGISKDEAERQVSDWSSSLDRACREAAPYIQHWAGDMAVGLRRWGEYVKAGIQSRKFRSSVMAVAVGIIIGVVLAPGQTRSRGR